MIKEIFKGLSKNMTVTQIVLFVFGSLFILLAISFDFEEIKQGQFSVHEMEIHQWIFLGLGVIFVLLGVLKNGTTKRHTDICKRLDNIEKHLKIKKGKK